MELPYWPRSSTATVLGVRAGEKKGGAEVSRTNPCKELCFAESCTMSRSLSHGHHSQAREQAVQEHGGVGESRAYSETSNISASLPIMSSVGKLVSG